MKMHINCPPRCIAKTLAFVVLLCGLVAAPLFAQTNELRDALPNLSDDQYLQLSTGALIYGLTIDGQSISSTLSRDRSGAQALLAKGLRRALLLGP